MVDVADRAFDERRRAVQARINGDALGIERRFQLGKRALDFERDLHRVRAELAGHRHQNAGPAHDERVAEFRLAAFDDPRHVLEPDARAVVLRDDDAAERLGRDRLAFALDQNALRRRLDKTGSPHAGRIFRRREHVLNREVERHEPLRLHLHLELAHLAAEHADLRNARHREQARAQRPVGDRPQRHRRKFFRDEADLQQVHRGRGERRHFRRFHAGRKLAREFREFFREHLARAENVGALLENGGDNRESLDRLGAHRFHVARAVDRALDRARDEHLDLLRREAGRFDLNRHLRLHKLGKNIQLHLRGDVAAVRKQDRPERENHAAIPQRKTDDGDQHEILAATDGHG